MISTTEAIQDSAELKEFKSVLQDWNAARFFFQDMKDELLNKFAVDGNSPPDEAAIKSILSSEPRHVSAELRFQKETFSKLKFNYLEQETKEKFLKRILDATPKFVSDKDVKELEARVKDHKAALKEKKKTAEELKQQLGEVAVAVCDAHSKLSLDFADAMELVQSIQELEAEMKEIEVQNASEQIQHARTKQESSKLIVEQAQDIAALERELEEWQAKARAAEGDLNMVETLVAGMQSHLSEAQEQVEEAERVARNRDVNLERFANWLSDARKALGHITGVENITVKPPASLHLTFKAQRSWVLVVAIHSDRTDRLVDIQIPGFTGPIQDILQQVNRKTFATTSILKGRRLEEVLPTAIHECMDRVRNWEKRLIEFEALRKHTNRFELKVLDHERVTVTLRPSRAQLVFAIDPDYPRFMGSVKLVDCSNVTGRHDAVLFEVYSQLCSQSKADSLCMLIGELEAAQSR